MDDDPTTTARQAHEYPMTSAATTDASLRKLLPRMWQLFAVAWLVFVLVVVGSELRANFTLGRLVALALWTAVFVAVYLWLMLRNPFRQIELGPAERQMQLGLLVALGALVAYFNLVYGPGLTWLFIYVLFAAGITLPTRGAVRAIALVVVAGLAIGVATGRWLEAVTQVPGVAAYGFAIVIVRRLVVTVRELEAARAELAHLAAAEAVAAERLRFARDLHDVLGHSLSVIALKSELAGRLVPTDRGRAAAEIADVQRVARQALREVRKAVAGYRRPALESELDAARKSLAAAGIGTEIEAPLGPLPPAIAAVLAWTVREGVTNVIRHSCARHCEIRIVRDGDAVRTEITDDGRGMPAGSPLQTTGSGLAGLAERIAEHGGHLATATREDDGFALSVILPLPMETAATESGGTHQHGAPPR